MAVEPVSYEVPGWGAGELWMQEQLLLAHEFRYVSTDAPAEARPSDARPPKGAHAPPTGTLAAITSREGGGSVPTLRRSVHAGSDLSASDLVARFSAFLAGEPVVFDDVELGLDWATPFQRELTWALRAIPRGEVVTYGELAALAGRPGAARAAGTFCATNRFAIVVPCHRVVAAGGIGGYGPDGVPVKRRLLALEGVRV